MDDIGLYDCPMPETFRDKLGLTCFLAVLFYLGFVSRILFAPLMPEIEVELGISHTQAGSLFWMMSVGYLLAPVCSGFISSKINHLGTLKFSALLVGIALLPCSFVHNMWVLGALLFVVGFAGSIHMPSAVTTITAEIQKSDWGKGLSVHQIAPPLSFVSAPLIAAFLLRWMSWRDVLLIWSVISILVGVIYTVKGRGGDFPGQVLSFSKVKDIYSRGSFWIMVILFATAMTGNAGIFAMLPLYLVHERGFELGTANTLLGLSQLSGLAVVYGAGWLTDRVGQKRVIVFSLFFAGTLTATIALTSGWLLVAALFVQPAVLTAYFPAGFAALSRIAPPVMRSVTSALGPPLAYMIGGGLMPFVIGFLAEDYSFSAGILFAGCCSIAASGLIYFVKLGSYDDMDGC